MAPSFESLVKLGSNLMSYRVSNHSLHASNIANAKTPNYQAKEMSFEAKLDQALSQGNEIMGDPQNWKLDVKVNKAANSPDEIGNTVKVDQEMAAMTQNAMQYLSTVKIISKQMALQRYASGGGM